MKKRVLVIGSCQSGMSGTYLRASPGFCHRYDLIKPTKQAYQMDDRDIEELHERLAESDAVIMQPISDEYRSPHQVEQPSGALSSKSMIESLKESATVMLFPVAFFPAYFPAYTRPGIRQPSDNHDTNLARLYLQAIKGSDALLSDAQLDSVIAAYVEVVRSPHAFSADHLQQSVKRAISALKVRERALKERAYARETRVIELSDFLSENYAEELLFNTCNHPRHAVYGYILEQLSEMMGFQLAPLPQFVPDDEVSVIYESLGQIVDFDVRRHTPALHNAASVEEVARLYLSYYEQNRQTVLPRFSNLL